jgi:hypothetical protein
MMIGRRISWAAGDATRCTKGGAIPDQTERAETKVTAAQKNAVAARDRIPTP